jgi:16S rRNA (adenine1518-N6/adenine1519-N6)-dimethyltransferase
MDLDLTVNQFLEQNNFNPSKKMGQNFLINSDICAKLVNSISFKNTDLIIEIGPGLGAITEYLVKKDIKIIAIELDKRLSEYITKKYPTIELINNDVLKIDFDSLTAKYKNPILVSNLPYSISSVVVVKFIKSNIKEMHCMLQKEMVLRMSAKKSTHEYNAFSVLLQTYATVTQVMEISKNNFVPPPNVDSIFISIVKNGKPYDKQYDNFIRSCFLSKRRTLINNLKNIVDKDKLIAYLNSNNISLTTRAEELSISQFEQMFNFIK